MENTRMEEVQMSDNREFESGFERNSKIMQTIEDIYAFIENCKMQPLSATKVVVPKDELYDLLDELRSKTPEEVKRYRKMIANRTQIIANAEEQAAEILADAKEQYSAMVEEHAIVQEAYRQAAEKREEAERQAEAIIRSANENAQQIYIGAISYTDELLSQAEMICNRAYESARQNTDILLAGLKASLEEIRTNRGQLTTDAEEQAVATEEVSEEEKKQAAEEEEELPKIPDYEEE